MSTTGDMAGEPFPNRGRMEGVSFFQVFFFFCSFFFFFSF